MSLEQPKFEKSLEPREQWLDSAKQAIKEQELAIDLSVPPYKAFQGEGDRFFVQKCIDKVGREVVVKVSSPEEETKKALEKEGVIYDLVQKSVDQFEKDSKEKLQIHFPQKLGEFNYSEQKGIIINYIKDDKEAMANLSPQEKIDLISLVLSEMHKLPVPEEETTKPYEKRAIEVLNADEHKKRWHYYVPDLVANGIVSKDDGKTLLNAIEKNKDLIGNYPLKLDHGDVHAGNIAYSRDKEAGKAIITLMDLEALKLDNEFSGIAHIVNQEDIFKQLQNSPKLSEILKIFPQGQKSVDLLRGGGITQKLEEDFVLNSGNPQSAERMYRLIRMGDALEQLHYYSCEMKSGAYKILQEGYQKILEEQIKMLPKKEK